MSVRDQANALHQACLRRLRAGDHCAALDLAVRRLQLSPDETARRLVGIASLCLGRYQAAMDACDIAAR